MRSIGRTARRRAGTGLCAALAAAALWSGGAAQALPGADGAGSAESRITGCGRRADRLALEVRELLRSRLESVGFPPRVVIAGEELHAAPALPAFYEERLYCPAWMGGRSRGAIRALLEAIDKAGSHGLRADDYHAAALRSALARHVDGGAAAGASALADIDLMLTDAFFVYASHLLAGRVDPATFDPEWIASPREIDLARLVRTALESGRVAAALKDLEPIDPGYALLRNALERHRRIAATGGWEPVPGGPALRAGDENARVALARARLIAGGDLAAAPPEDPGRFDGSMEEAARRFQVRHGLTPDGVIGAKTLAAMNVPVEERIRQIELNLERWRWLPQDLGDPHVLINIPDFSLVVAEAGKRALTMGVIVGRRYRRTPVFSDTMRYLVFNPSWEIPTKLAIQDKLPLIREDPGYLQRERIRVFDGWGGGAREIDPSRVDWSSLGPERFPYRLRQEPGPWNALGRVKFMFPNRFNVYLHDTPGRELFMREERGFSSGCVRVEKPIELAAYLLGRDPDWTLESIESVIASGVETTVPLPQPVAVHLLYWTAWVEAADGSLRFRPDIYGRDALLQRALDERGDGRSSKRRPVS